MVSSALGDGNGVISFQVFQETLHVITRKLKVAVRPHRNRLWRSQRRKFQRNPTIRSLPGLSLTRSPEFLNTFEIVRMKVTTPCTPIMSAL